MSSRRRQPKVPRPPRPYSLNYTAKGKPRRYLLSGIPPTLWEKFERRAKREHIAKRQILLAAVEAWVNRPADEAQGEAGGS